MDFEHLIYRYFVSCGKLRFKYFKKIWESIHNLDELCFFLEALTRFDYEWKIKEKLIRDLWNFYPEKKEQ